MQDQQYQIVKFEGLVLDIPPAELTGEVWTACSNIHFTDSSTKRSGGYAQFADPPSGPPIWLLPVLDPITAFWIYATASNLYVTDGTNHFDITPVGGLTATEPGDWTGGTLNGVPVCNNGIDPPMWWDGNTANPAQTLPGWPANTTCKALRPFKYHLVAMNIEIDSIRYQDDVMWSSAADPGTIPTEWTSTPSNDAGRNQVGDAEGGIIDGGQLRDIFVIYKQHTTYLMSYIAGQYVFSFRKAFLTSGIQARNCWAEVMGKHVVFTDDDVIVHDAQSGDSVVNLKIKNYLLSSIGPENQKGCCVTARHSTNEVWVCIPGVDTTLLLGAVVISMNTGHCGIRQLPLVGYVERGIIPEDDFDVTWDGATTTWANDGRFWNEANYSVTADVLLMAGTNDTKLYEVDASPDDNGTPLEAYVQRDTFTFGDIWENKVVRSIYPRITGQTGDTIRARVGVQQAMGDPIQWSNEQDIPVGELSKVDVLLHGRYISMRFASTGGQPWNIHSVGIEYIPMAKY